MDGAKANQAKGHVTAKLDMTLDDLIASASPNSRKGRGAKGRARGGRRRWSETRDGRRMEIDGGGGKVGFRYGGGFNRNRRSDLIQTRTAVRTNGRGNRHNRFASTRWDPSPTVRRPRGLWSTTRTVTAGTPFDGVSTMDVDEVGETMSDGEIPSTAPTRRQLMLESRWKLNAKPGRRRRVDGRMIRISGLDYTILKSDLEELFQSVGPIERCWIDYDKTDRSLGTGGVIFQNTDFAILAIREFDRRTIDGQELRLELVGGDDSSFY